MRIDAHIHFWRLARGVNTALSADMTAIYADRQPQDLAPLLARTGIDAIVCVQASETLGENLFMLGLAERHDWIAGVVGWLDPGSPALDEELAALTTIPRFKGIRPVRNDNRSVRWMLDESLADGWCLIENTDLTVDLLVQDWRELPIVTQLAQRYRKTTFILDHCGKPDIAGGQSDEWMASIDTLANLPNVFCKLSGLLNCAAPGADASVIRPWSDHVLERFGSHRVMWASDWPPLDLVAHYARWSAVSDDLLAALEPDQRKRILGATAASFYRL